MKNSGIYKIQSKIKPERVYIGSAANLEKRWNDHCQGLRKNKHKNPKLQSHYNKYGESDFVFIIIEPCLPPFLTIREQYYIDTIIPWFNICKIAGSPLGLKWSEESKQKVRGNKNHRFGKCPSTETRQKHRESAMGNKYSLGVSPSELTRNKMSESHKRYFETEKGKEEKQRYRLLYKGKTRSDKIKGNIKEGQRLSRIKKSA